MAPKDRREKANRHPSSGQTTHPASSATFVAVVLFLLTALLFTRSLFNDFIYSYDDELYVAGNENLAEGITLSSLVYIVTPGVIANWHPVTMFSHALDVELFGLAPWGHHLTSVLLHAINTTLLFMLLRGATGAHWRSAIVAALFALHPLHVQSAAMIGQRKDLLSTLFLFLAFYAYANRRPGDRFMLRTQLWLVLSLLSKPMAVTFPFMLLLLDYWPLKRFAPSPGNPRTSLRAGMALIVEKWPFFAAVAAMSVITFLVQKDYGATATLSGLPIQYRLQNVVLSYAEYLSLCIWPAGLSAFYPYPTTFPLWKTCIAASLLAAITIAAAIQWRRIPYFVTGWLWYLGSLVPVIGFVQVGTQGMADRYTYIPLIGIFVTGVWGVHEFVLKKPALRGVVAAGITVVLLILAARTWIEIGYWQNAETLWKRSLAVTTDNSTAHRNLQSIYISSERWEEAVVHGYAAIHITPTPGHKQAPEPFLGLARSLQRLGRDSEAIGVLEKAKSLHPEHPAIYFELASCFMSLGKTQDAEDAVRKMPGFPSAIEETLGNIFLNARQFDIAEKHYKEAIRIDPAKSSAYLNYAQCLDLMGKSAEAREMYAKALALNPEIGARRSSRVTSP